MMFRYEGAVAVVSGASSGLGRRLAVDLAGRGATVVAVARRATLLDELVAEPRASGAGAVEAAPCDVGDLEAWAALLADVEARHGRVDVLVNAAGVERRKGIETVQWDDVEEALTVNFRAAARSTVAVLPGMLERGRGAVLNISSDHGRAPGPGTPAYCASKAALSAFTESIAHEVRGRGVAVHVLYPGWVPTPLGQGAVDSGMPLPPRVVRRTEEEVSRLALDRIGSANFEINAARIATLAPVVRALLPPAYRKSMQITA
jgi:short-subunit dehydrogenase